MARHRKNPADQHDQNAAEAPTTLRVIGGEFRGRKLVYTGDLRTRPMKDRVREAVFNLVGTDARGRHAVDLFAGTGALGFEALSRGAVRATFMEQHFPTARVVRQNAALLGAADRCQVDAGNVFFWSPGADFDAETPWLVFCSPPYAFYVDRKPDILGLIERMLSASPPGSVFVVESDNRFDPALLPAEVEWDVRPYPPAVVAIGRKALSGP